MRMSWVGLVLVVLVSGAACGPVAPAVLPEEARPAQRAEIEGLRDRQARRAEALEAAVADGAECAPRCEHAGQICRLGTRICALTMELPEDDPAWPACGEARGVCASAYEQVPGRCACPPR